MLYIWKFEINIIPTMKYNCYNFISLRPKILTNVFQNYWSILNNNEISEFLRQNINKKLPLFRISIFFLLCVNSTYGKQKYFPSTKYNKLCSIILYCAKEWILFSMIQCSKNVVNANSSNFFKYTNGDKFYCFILFVLPSLILIAYTLSN